MSDATIIGVGHYLPPKVVTNADLPATLNASPEWIEKRTGIRARRYVEGRVNTSDLAAEACRAAVKDAGLTLREIDSIVAATISGDHFFPGVGMYTQRKLGLKNVPAYEIRNQCSSFLYALNVARSFVLSGFYRNVLIGCAEVQSRGLGKSEMHRSVTPLFGDGAGAVVVQGGEAPPSAASATRLSIDYVRVYADGEGADALRLRIIDAAVDPWFDWAQVCDSPERWNHPEMDGQRVFRSAVAGMVAAAKDALSSQGLTIRDIAWVLPHQANLQISESVALCLGVPPERVRNNIQHYGNTTAASIPILLSETLADGLVQQGDRLLLLAFGSGFTWGAAILRRA